MDPEGLIRTAENKYKQLLEGFFSALYNEKNLPSHGISHHRRVWNYAKELILVLADKVHWAPCSVNSLILASYLHDLGMTVDQGPEHGRHSRELAMRFLSENKFREQDFPGMLQAINDHDNKKYTTGATLNVNTLLSIADDLDAFGFTGIYRYVEIYHLRGIDPGVMGTRIRENAAGRYLHFVDFIRDKPQYLDKHRVRYKILDNFFKSYDNQLREGDSDHGYLKVVRLLADMINTRGIPAEISEQNKNDMDHIVSWFFKNLLSEPA